MLTKPVFHCNILNIVHIQDKCDSRENLLGKSSETEEQEKQFQKKSPKEGNTKPMHVKHRSQLAGRLLVLLIVFVICTAMIMGMVNTHRKQIFYATESTLADLDNSEEKLNNVTEDMTKHILVQADK